jgi:hypothetical protein
MTRVMTRDTTTLDHYTQNHLNQYFTAEKNFKRFFSDHEGGASRA